MTLTFGGKNPPEIVEIATVFAQRRVTRDGGSAIRAVYSLR
jgi:hypothetical protein